MLDSEAMSFVLLNSLMTAFSFAFSRLSSLACSGDRIEKRLLLSRANGGGVKTGFGEFSLSIICYLARVFLAASSSRYFFSPTHRSGALFWRISRVVCVTSTRLELV